MLRINLLPAYIEEQKKTRNVIIATSLAVAALTGVLAFYTFSILRTQVDTQIAAANEEERKALEVTALKEQAANILSAAKPITDKTSYVEQVAFYNKLRQRIYRRVAQYTYKDVEYSAMNIQGQALTLGAYAKKLSDVGRFYIQLFNNPDLSAVSISGIPGWPKNQQGGGGGGAFGGAGGGYPGAGGGRGSIAGVAGGPSASLPPGALAGGGGAPPNFGGGDGTGDTSSPQGLSPEEKQRALGVPLAVTATLIKPVARPVLPGTVTGQAGGAAGGGFSAGGGAFGAPGGGYPGGYPGGGAAAARAGEPD